MDTSSLNVLNRDNQTALMVAADKGMLKALFLLRTHWWIQGRPRSKFFHFHVVFG